MDKIVLIVNGPSPIKEVSSNTILVHNPGLSLVDNNDRQRNVNSVDSKRLDPEIKDPKSGKISKLSKLIEEKKAKDKAEEVSEEIVKKEVL
jgi:hypothetical protein